MAEAAFTPATFADTLPTTQISHRPSNIQTDPLLHLPSGAADRLRMLEQHASDLHALVPEFAIRFEANNERAESERRIQRLLEHPSRGGFGLEPTDPRVAAERRKFDVLIAEARRVDERYKQRSQAWMAASQIVAAVRGWLAEGRPRGTTLEAYEGPEPKLQNGETDVADAISNRRRRVRDLKARLHTIQSACFPSSHCKKRVREIVEVLAAQGAPSVSRLVETDGDLEWPDKRYSVPIIAGTREAPVTAVAHWQQPDAVALVCWLLRPQLEAALDRLVDEESDDKASLTHEARGEAEAEVLSDIVAVEREEAEFCWKALASGAPIEWRADISPLALLGLQLRTLHAVASPGTSIEHAISFTGPR